MSNLLARLIEQTGIAPSPNSKVARIVWKNGVQDSRELRRVLALPRRTLDLDRVPDLTPLYAIEGQCTGCDLCRTGKATLWKLQSAMLFEAEQKRGALGPMPVGSGKTLTALLLADALNAKMAVLLVPPSVRDQLIDVDIPRLSRHFALPLHRLRVVSYSQLSRANSADVLDQINPDLIIADEAHNLKYKSAARTKRFLRFMKAHPGCAFVPLSGTITTKSVRDYAHLSELALRSGSPVPCTYGDVEEWSAALDVNVSDDERMPPGALLKFCNEEELALEDKTEAARRGFRRRLMETPGVIGSMGADVNASIFLRAVRGSHMPIVKGARVIDMPPAVLEHIRSLHRTWEIAGEELEDAMAFARVARQLAYGFYYVWDWPGEVDYEWLDARKVWHKAVRTFLVRSAKPGLDSPMLLANACMRGQLPQLEQEWNAWAAVRERPQPPTKPIWIDKFVVNDMVTRAANGQPGIIWYDHRAIEAALRDSGMVVFGAGDNEGVLAARPEEYPVIACSVRAHGTGKNLQHWADASYGISPSNATTWQQVIAREHRPGQQADEVTGEVYQQTADLVEAFESSIAGARYVEQTTGERQKLLFATKVGF